MLQNGNQFHPILIPNVLSVKEFFIQCFHFRLGLYKINKKIIVNKVDFNSQLGLLLAIIHTLMENPTSKRKSPLIFVLGAVILALAFFGIRALLHRMKYEGTDNAQVESRSTPVISRVAGYIDSLGVDDFGKVTAGQRLVRLDDIENKLALLQAQTHFMNSKTDNANAQAAPTKQVAGKKPPPSKSRTSQKPICTNTHDT